MRIPFPERVRINRVILFALVLFAIQRFEGTTLFFATGCAFFIVIAALAFNAAGGLTRASGAYVFFYSVLVVIIGICYKAYLGEPGQSNLLDPRTTIEAYVGTITAMLGAVIVSRRFSRKQGLLQNLLKESEMYRSSVGCMVVGVAVPFLLAMLGTYALRAQTAFNQLNQLVPLGIIIGVMYEIRSSGGKRSLNLPILLGGLYYFYFGGVIGFSKQGLLTPFYCWIVPVCAMRFRLSLTHIAASALFVFATFYYLVPFSQYGRSFVFPEQTLSQKVVLSTNLLEHPNETRDAYLKTQEYLDVADRGLNAYYDTPQGFWERLQFVSVDDKLINFTDQGHVFGLLPIKMALYNAVPHILWPNKPNFNEGFMFVLEMNGEIFDPNAPEVGISFSTAGEAYHLAKWLGVLFISPLVLFVLFVTYDSLFGDIRATPWGLLALALISHMAPEGGLTTAIYLLGFGTEILVFCALFATWFAPIFAIPVIGPDRSRSVPRLAFQPAHTPHIEAAGHLPQP